eukprot:6754961-Prorocentrum_lima.AAC.1
MEATNRLASWARRRASWARQQARKVAVSAGHWDCHLPPRGHSNQKKRRLTPRKAIAGVQH